MVCSMLIEPKMSSGGHRAAEKSSSSLSDRPSLGTSLKPCIRRLIVYTDTLAEWVYGYVDLAWLCLRIRRLGGSCLRILSTDTTGIHASPGEGAVADQTTHDAERHLGVAQVQGSGRAPASRCNPAYLHLLHHASRCSLTIWHLHRDAAPRLCTLIFLLWRFDFWGCATQRKTQRLMRNAMQPSLLAPTLRCDRLELLHRSVTASSYTVA